MGFFIGRQTTGSVDKNQVAFQNLIAANQQVQAANSEINPLLAGVEKVKYNSQTGEVELFYTTVNDIQLNGDLNSPTVRQMLSHAMLEEENPSVRLHAVKALKVFAEEVAGAKEVKYVPAYFPFTEPSVEVFIKHDVLGWFELGGSGIFRPEVTEPLGINVPVLAWGLGIDRMALMSLGLNDLRDLFTNDIEQVRLRRRRSSYAEN